MIARTEELYNQIDLLQEAVRHGEKGLLEAFEDLKGLQSEMWRAELGEKLDNAKQSVLNGLQSAKDWAAEKYNTASQAISDWFEEMKNKMSVAWGEFKEYAGQKFENFKEAMQQFGENIAEMWGKAMESLGKLFDEIKIGAHDMLVDAKTTMLNLGTDMSCGVANLGIAMQKGVLAMDDAFQSVKGTVPQAVADKFNKSAGQLLVESESAYQDMLNTRSEFSKMDFAGQDDKTIVSAQKYQETVLDKMSQDHAKLTEKIQSTESFRDTFQGIKDGATQKVQANKDARDDLNIKSQLKTDQSFAKKIDRYEKTEAQKSSYADKVRQGGSAPGTGRGM